MIVAEDAISVLPAYLFLLYMLLPSLSSWYITTLWVQRCWIQSRDKSKLKSQLFTKSANYPVLLNACLYDDQSEQGMLRNDVESKSDHKNFNGSSAHSLESKSDAELARTSLVNGGKKDWANKEIKSDNLMKQVTRVVVSPFPYAMLILMGGMIVLIFVEIMSIAGLVCVTAVVMVVVLVLGNHWRGLPILGTEGAQAPLTAEEKIANTNEFFEELFNSIDYSLLLIFLGTFVVVANVDSTGIPKQIWDKIVGKAPFDTIHSVVGISLFVLISSQLLGNVAVIQLAKPNVETLGDEEKKYAWSVISFIATIGGNLTITGSAANIIVAEKVRRLDPRSSIDFFRHYHVCFWITLFCCFLGGAIISGVVLADSNGSEKW